MRHDTALSVLGQRQSRSARHFLGPFEASGNPSGTPRSLYIHVPFCFHKCHYCDFYSIVDTRDRQEAFTSRLISELTALARHSRGSPLDTIFVGGGTPTLLKPDLWQRLLAAMHALFDLSNMGQGPGEWTVECNPETATPELMGILHAGGVNRVSMGAQSFNPRHLKTLERWHDPENVSRALELARAAGIRRDSIDLIFAIPGQTLEDWQSDLRRALELGTTHLSCYSLTYEPNTAMTARMKRGEFAPADEDLEVEMHQLTLDTLRAAGFERYEVSNYAKLDQVSPSIRAEVRKHPASPPASTDSTSLADNRSQHNLAYWRQHQWLAAGPSASGHVAGYRWKNSPRLDDYLDTNDDGYASVIDVEPPDPRRALAERMMTGLRILEGIDLASVIDEAAKLASISVAHADAPARLLAARRQHIEEGHLIDNDHRLILTDAGFLLADGIAGEFMECLDP